MQRMTRGFSLVELLVVFTIIAILMALYLPALSRARARAINIVKREAMRQEHIGNMSDGKGTFGEAPDVEKAVALFREKQSYGKYEVINTTLVYVVKNEAEFKAYWHTLINPASTVPLETDRDGSLIAYDEQGNVFYLPPFSDKVGTVPRSWEFISTNLQETSLDGTGSNVRYSDGHVEYIPYPGRFPICSVVAELSHRFVAESS